MSKLEVKLPDISGESKIEMARQLAVRSALKLEVHGFRRSRRPSARQLANDITGQNHHTARAAYASLNNHIMNILGEQFDRPLETE